MRYADLRGFSFSREDVAAANLANEYSTATMGLPREMPLRAYSAFSVYHCAREHVIEQRERS